MPSIALLEPILNDEALTRDLGDPEARVLVEWLVEQAEQLNRTARPEAAAAAVSKLCRRGRAIGRFVSLWCGPRGRGAAGQLAAAERFAWPLPDRVVDPYELMRHIVAWETRQPGRKEPT